MRPPEFRKTPSRLSMRPLARATRSSWTSVKRAMAHWWSFTIVTSAGHAESIGSCPIWRGGRYGRPASLAPSIGCPCWMKCLRSPRVGSRFSSRSRRTALTAESSARCMRSCPGTRGPLRCSPSAPPPLGQVAGPLSDEDITRLRKLSSRRLLGALVSRPDFINYDLRPMPDAWLDTVSRLASLPVICWTVRTDQDQQKAERLGLNYVFENVRP
jgi:hypothetical protein